MPDRQFNIKILPLYLSLVFLLALQVSLSFAWIPDLSYKYAASTTTTRSLLVQPPTLFLPQQDLSHANNNKHTILYAGGFEWHDPSELDPTGGGVENPYKNPQLLLQDGSSTLKIDPARLLSPRLNGINLYLIGMMGTGKSTVGKVVAKRMGSYTFLDTDEIIEKAAGMSIPEIFASEGEHAFRKIEGQVLESVYPYVRCVVSTGGGIVCRMENWSKLHTGIVVWLDVAPEIIYERIKKTGNRPLLQTDDPLQTLKDLLEERKSKYQNADVRIEISSADLSENDVADIIVRELHNFIDDNPPAWKLAKSKAQAEGLDWVK